MSKSRASERTCVACREKTGPDDLVRLVVSPDGVLVVDARGRLPGRGAWVHPRSACVDALEKKPGKLRHVLQQPELQTSDLKARLLDVVVRALGEGLSMAAASGSLVGGHDVLSRELEAGRVAMVACASDAAERTTTSLQRVAGEDVTFVTIPLGREALGARVGRGPRAAVGVLPTRGAAHLRAQLRRLADLG